MHGLLLLKSNSTFVDWKKTFPSGIWSMCIRKDFNKLSLDSYLLLFWRNRCLFVCVHVLSESNRSVFIIINQLLHLQGSEESFRVCILLDVISLEPLSHMRTVHFISSVRFLQRKNGWSLQKFFFRLSSVFASSFFFLYILQLESLTTQVPEPFFPFKNGPFVSLHPFFISSVFNGKKK